MLIQITKEKFIRKKDIIGVFDLDTSTVSGVTKSFLSRAEKNNRTVGITALPKSFVLTDETEDRIYFSSSMTGHINKSGLG
jgi:hypothetical protein